MKKNIFCPALLLTTISSIAFIAPVKHIGDLTGAWGINENGKETTVVFQDGYVSFSVFNKAQKLFVHTYGGPYRTEGNKLKYTIEYHTSDKQQIGSIKESAFSIADDALQMDINGAKHTFSRIDNGSGPLAGNWRITGRMQNDKMSEIQRSDRKTLKLLSGTRFQWMAINPATKEFFGTGGGTYTFKDGKYTEYIEFFSRDSSRVGAVLAFDGKVEGDKWEHSGKSSKGDPIHEIWSRDK